jgi:gibberellin-44 dioxygenase
VFPGRVPIVDLSLVQRGDEASLATLRAASTSGGAFYLVNHGVSEALLAELLDQTRAFYALPFEQRSRTAIERGVSSGYQPRDRFNEVFFVPVIDQRTPDLDYSLFGESTAWPEQPRNLEARTMAFVREMRAAADHLLHGIARGIAIDPCSFDPFFGPSAVQIAQLRFYAPQREFQKLLDAHFDPNALALIVQDEIGGLEGLLDGEWVPIPPLPGTIVCTIGQALSAWSDDRIATSTHRVVHDPTRERLSLVYTLTPRLDAPMESIGACRDRMHPARYPAIDCAEFLARYLRAQSERSDD